MNQEQDWQHVDEAIDWIHSLLPLGVKPGLKRMEWMLEKCNHPQRRLKFIHVGGTNGKGSTVSYLRHVLQQAGFEVGSFTSPYIERFQNRIQLNGVDISDQDLLMLARRVKPLVDELAQSELGSPTEFEIVTMIAILYYGTVAYPDLVIWEVGLGGRLDSTNVITPILSVITNVGYDHIHILGNQIEEIAYEKAGIIKSGIPLVTGSKDERALAVLRKKAKEMKSTMYVLDEQFKFTAGPYDQTKQSFVFQSMFGHYEQLSIQMKGTHQLENASVAIMALEVIKQYYAILWTEEELRRGLYETRWPGRLEVLAEQPLVLIDGAHNPEGLAALSQVIQQYFRGKRITVLFSAMKDKEIPEMLAKLDGQIETLILTQFDFPRVAAVAEMMKQLSDQQRRWRMEIRGEENWKAAYDQAYQQADSEDVILITGSLYFISEVRKKLKKL